MSAKSTIQGWPITFCETHAMQTTSRGCIANVILDECKVIAALVVKLHPQEEALVYVEDTE